MKHFIIEEEATQFKLTGDHKTFWIPGDYDSNEFLYNTTKLSEVDAYKAEKEDVIENIYVPVGLTRSFTFSFTIEELGDGKARITINKNV